MLTNIVTWFNNLSAMGMAGALFGSLFVIIVFIAWETTVVRGLEDGEDGT